MTLCRIPCCLSLLFFLCSCGGEKEAPPPGGEEQVEVLPSPPVALIAVLRPGPNPLWFDASGQPVGATGMEGDAPAAADTGVAAEEGAPAEPLAGGLRLVDSPALAELSPFTPWPLAPHAAALLTHRGIVYLALNRNGLLAFLPMEGGDLGLYRFAATDYWESYTVGNLFLYDDKPALFFYRNDTFAEPAAPPPDPPVLALFPPAGGRGTAEPSDLFEGGLEPLEIPALAGIPFTEGWEADIMRPGADGLWYYRAVRRKNGGRETRYFRTPDLSRRGEEIGPGLYRNSQQEKIAEPDLSGLPPLPEDFFYTHVVRQGDLVIASWEEQRDYNIGAAGFMVVRGL